MEPLMLVSRKPVRISAIATATEESSARWFVARPLRHECTRQRKLDPTIASAQ
jgi:hypothetical protein